jgi:hypothetical protein
MERILNVRHRLKYDTYTNWMTNNPTLLAGEVAIATFPQDDTSGESTTLPAILLKVGDGTHSYSALPFVSAKAADVHGWAKMTEDEMKDWILENIPSSNNANIKDGSGVGSLQQSFDTEVWLPSNTRVIDAINEELGTEDDGHTINIGENGEVTVGAFGKHSIMTGGKSQNVGKKSFTSGSKNIAFESNSAAFGNETFAKGKHSFAQGNRTTASGNGSHAEGQDTEASGFNAHSEGLETKAIGNYSHSEGRKTSAIGHDSHVEGIETRTLSEASHAEGNTNVAGCLGYYYSSFDVNNNTFTVSNIKGTATEIISTGWNVGDVVSIVNDAKYYRFGQIEKIEGNVITVSNMPEWLPENTINGQPHPVDFSNPNFDGFDDFTIWVHDKPECGVIDIGMNAHVEGISNKAISYNTHAEGRQNISYGQYSHTEGRKNQAGHGGHAEGFQTHAKGMWSHAEGEETTSIGKDSHAEGCRTQAIEVGAHSEGNNTTAMGLGAHAEGNDTYAIGIGAHAEGQTTQAEGDQAHAEGYMSRAESYSHAEGIQTYANSGGNHAEGVGSVAKGYGQHAQGRYNVIDEEGKYAHVVGNGWADSDGTEHRNNIHTLDWDGNVWFAGNITVGESQNKVLTTADLSSLGELKYTVVNGKDELPAADSQEAKNTIFLVPVENGETENYYEEYLTTGTAYELIGTRETEIDLSNYVQKDAYYGSFHVQKSFGTGEPYTTMYYKALTGEEQLQYNVQFYEKESIDGLQYYGDMFVIPTDQNLFTFETDDTNGTATVTRYTGTSNNIVIPFEFYDNNMGRKYKVTSIKGGYGSNGPENRLGNAQTIILPNTITSIGEYGFACSKITSLELPSSVKTIGSCAFYETKNLKNLKLNEGLESLSGYSIFYFSALNYLEIPSTVQFICKDTLALFSSESKITIRILNPNYEFDPEDFYTSNVTFICPENSLCEQSLINLKLSDIQQKTFNYSIDSFSMTDTLILNCGDSNF